MDHIATVDGCEILHQLVDGLSYSIMNPIVYSASCLPNSFQLVQDFFHPQYVSLQEGVYIYTSLYRQHILIESP